MVEREESPHSQSATVPPRGTRAILPTILVLGLVLRLVWMVTQAHVVSSDGGEYATMAEHLLHQHALIGTYEGPEILYAPLYPLLIAAVMLVVPNSETAAHLVSLLSGTALIAIVFLLAQRLYDRRTALISAALVAVHPMLIALSGSIYNETLYLTMWMTMAYVGLRALALQRVRNSLLLGLCIGLLYLIRVEAAAYVAFFAGALLTAGLLRKQTRTAGMHALIMSAAFLVVASPYIYFFYTHTHQVRLEAKWNINYTMARNRLAGMNSIEADWGLAHDLTIQGPLLEPFSFVDFTPYSHTLGEQVESVAALVKHNARTVYRYLLDGLIGAPVLWGLVIVGWCRRSWDNRRLRDEALWCALVASIVAVTVTSATAEMRYVFPIVPVLLLWSGNGLRELTQWIMGWELIQNFRRVRLAWIAVVLPLSAATLMMGRSIDAVQQRYFTDGHSAEAAAARDAGLWLAKQEPKSKRIAVRLAVVPYYAKGTLIAFPYGDPEATLRHFARKKVDFIVLESAEVLSVPTVGQWLAHGIPDPRARLVYDKTSAGGVRVAIYKWFPELNPSVNLACTSDQQGSCQEEPTPTA